MQFGFMAGRSTTDAIFIVCQLQEKYLAKNKELWMAFVDLEKAFDRVPRKVIWWTLRYLGVDEWIVSVIKAMCEDATTKVRLNGRESNAFSVRVGVHQHANQATSYPPSHIHIKSSSLYLHISPLPPPHF